MFLSAKRVVRILIYFLVMLLILLYLALSAAADQHTLKRQQMVEQDIRGRGIRDPVVLGVMGRVPRHVFVDASYQDKAYGDHPLPIGEGQTISQPYVVALMTEALGLRPADRVLEIGTGSGYQAAVLAEIVKEVYTIEIRKPLADRAAKTLADLGYRNVKVKFGDGYFGWAEQAPYDAIIITAAANHIPPPLIDQLKERGRLIVPLGSTVYFQTLTLATKRKGELDVEQICPVAFVPMTGKMLER
ncbi:MAG: protein-L-isoaspartate(D-aspartate) O-methyltransferase [Nitrospirae bacterium]|nr:protein-L-isoaspartate(D-aspartate) O-methyltransferase [Nitrospirota bacterium]NTW65621.1 protein-L-isoaspartate(D-aspartate) O-methyltransferase [Nitrospirota bacterium]